MFKYFKNISNFSTLIIVIISFLLLVGLSFFYYRQSGNYGLSVFGLSKTNKTDSAVKTDLVVDKKENAQDSETEKNEADYQSVLERALANGSQVEFERKTNPKDEDKAR